MSKYLTILSSIPYDTFRLYKNFHPRTHQDKCEHNEVVPYHKYGSIRQSFSKNSIVTDTLACCKVQSAMILHCMNSMDSPDLEFYSHHHMLLCNRTIDPIIQIHKMFLRDRIQLLCLLGFRLGVLFDKVHCQLVYFVEYNND